MRWCLAEGIDQFLDLGSGVATVGNVHEVALAHAPGARVAYVDFEPVAVEHSPRAVTAELDTVTVTRADLCDPGSVLAAPGVAGLLDLDRPVAVLMLAVLHFVADDAARLVGRYRDALAPGSVVAISHNSDDQDDAELGAALRGVGEAMRGSATELTLRDRPGITALFGGLEVVPPGLADVTAWPRPSGAAPVGIYGAVGRVRVSVGGSPRTAWCSGPTNEVISAMRPPSSRRTSTDQAVNSPCPVASRHEATATWPLASATR